VLSSGLVAAFIGITFTLFGLLYRAGFLLKFGVSPEIFLPESTFDLSYWGYMGALDLLATLVAGTATWTFWFPVVCGLAIALLLMNLQLALESRSASARIRLFRRKAWKSRAIQSAIGSIAAAVSVPLLLGMIIVVTVFLVGLPLYGYSAGQKEAERWIANYKSALSSNPERCARLHGVRGDVGNCVLIIAQSKDRVAFADRDHVRVVSSNSLETSWTAPALQKQLDPR
jgi:hypothetical protein